MTLFARLSALVLMLCLVLPVMAMSLDEAKNALEAAKSQGLVGETPSGYLAAVGSDRRAREIVNAINDARREAYEKIAEKHGIAVAKVEAVAGQKAVDKTPPGQYIQIDGRWVRK
ncbi:MAG: YdbL family protein [Halioglobus sp.]|nr:YdbL family protein [Halioglobus sp.]